MNAQETFQVGDKVTVDGHTDVWTVVDFWRGAYVCKESTYGTTCEFYPSQLARSSQKPWLELWCNNMLVARSQNRSELDRMALQMGSMTSFIIQSLDQEGA